MDLLELCKHCGQAKGLHQHRTYKCPPTFGTDTCFEPVRPDVPEDIMGRIDWIDKTRADFSAPFFKGLPSILGVQYRK